jgi:hypothetical protein
MLASSEATVVDDDVFLLTAVSDGGLSSAWLVERIDYALSNLSYSIAGGTVVVGFTVAIVLAIGCSFTRKVALSHGAAVEKRMPLLRRGTALPAAPSARRVITTIRSSMHRRGRCLQCRTMPPARRMPELS